MQGINKDDNSTTRKNEVEKLDRLVFFKSLGLTLIVQQLWKRIVRTFRPHHPEIGIWKFNMSKNIWKVVRNHCSFDKLMDKYKKEHDLSQWTNTNSMNRPLKIRVFTSQTIWFVEVDCCSFGLGPTEESSSCLSLGSSGVASYSSNVRAYGVWVPYRPMVPMMQPMQGAIFGPSVCHSVFSRLNFS